ncbi:hypothetical protein P12x_000969 [Tundrisphaera lichenicola]|uniref:hypothetical protein n=1 Tax=Tundrisphaera lichenicola TaxID=2029860 RepID=UPI003EBB08DA
MTLKVGNRRIWMTFALGSMAILAPRTSRADDPPVAKPSTLDAFEQADLEFRTLYAMGRAETLARLGPVIVVEMDQLILLRDGRRTAATVIPPRYHRLKSISHIPLALYVALAPWGDGPIDEARLNKLRSLRTRILAVSGSIDGLGFEAAQASRSRQLLEHCLAFLEATLGRGHCETSDLTRLTREAGPVVLANAADAAQAQIDAYHEQVSSWRREIPPDEWSRLHVLILGPQMPRKHNVAAQYFAKLLGLPGESLRLVYAEESMGEQQGLNLLATHTLDRSLSGAFFGDPDRMEIDLLGNAASVYLDAFDFDR